MAKKEVIIGNNGVMVEEFWKDHGNKVLAITAAIGAGAAAILLVRTFLEGRRKRKEADEIARLNVGQFVEEAMVLGEEHGGKVVASAAEQLAQSAPDEEVSVALGAVAQIAGQTKNINN